MTDGYSAAFIGAAAVAIVGAILAAVLLRIPSAPTASVDVTEPTADRQPAAV